MDSLISEDDYYYYQRNPDRQLQNLDRSLDLYTNRNRDDNHEYHQQPIQYIPRPQVQHRSLHYNYNDEYEEHYDRRSRYISDRNQDYSEQEYRSSTTPRWRRRSERFDTNYLDVDADWSQYRGRWRSLYDGLEARADHYQDSSWRTERNYLERDRYRRSLERQRYSASTATVNHRARGNQYDYYERNDDFL